MSNKAVNQMASGKQKVAFNEVTDAYKALEEASAKLNKWDVINAEEALKWAFDNCERVGRKIRK